MPTLLLTATTTADQLPVGQWLAVAAVTFLVYRVARIVLFPNAPCGHCKGKGKHFDGKYWRDCRWCRGRGKKTRFGRRVWDWTTRSKEAAQ